MNESLSVVVDLLIVFVGLRKNPHHLRCGIRTQDAGEGVKIRSKKLYVIVEQPIVLCCMTILMSIEKNDIEVVYRE